LIAEVENNQDAACECLAARVAGSAAQLQRQRTELRILPVLRVGTGTIGTEPTDITVPISPLLAVQKAALAQVGESAAQLDQVANKPGQLMVLRRPVNPPQFVILRVGIVVALLAVAKFVAGQQHGHTLGKQQGGQQAADAQAT